MTRWSVQPIETYDLLPYAVPKPCYVCEGDNRHDADHCRHCRAPLALAYQVESRRAPPHMIAVIGPPGSGKTVYLGMLTDMLSRQHGAMHILARGAFSVALQQQTMQALSRRQFPPSTSTDPDGWNWVHCEVRGLPKRRAVELVLPDVAGQTVINEVEHPNRFPMIRTFLSKCTAAMLIVDAERLEQGDPEQDFQAMKAITYLSELNPHQKKGWPRRPVAVVFCKADNSPSCWDDPARYAARLTPGLWRQCQDRMKCHQFFAASVVGACASGQYRGDRFAVPLRVEPRGVVEPFAWLVDQVP